MPTPTLTMAGGRYDTTEALFNGTVTVDGFTTEMRTAPTLPEIFQPMLADQAFDAAELGMTFYLRALDAVDGDLPYVALPIFPNRVFRHSCVFVNRAAGITSPADLVGKTIGEFGTYGQDSGVWAKGVLMDEYGFVPKRNRWVIGGLDRPAPPFDFTTHPHPADVDVRPAPADKSLGDMLEAGEIDALFTANVPQRVLDGSSRIHRLFDDYESVERDYFHRTGIFPFMHPVVVSRAVLQEYPGAARAIYDAYLRSKEAAAQRYRQNLRLFEVHTMVPWMNSLFERNQRDLPPDWWPYGLEANRITIDAFLRHHFEQGLSARRWSAEEIFWPIDAAVPS